MTAANLQDESAARKPWLKFYPADWRAEIGLRTCSPLARLLWLEMILIMHEAPIPGVLIKFDGEKFRPSELAAITALPEKGVRDALVELERAGVFSRDNSGRIYSRKMVKNSAISERNRENVEKRWAVENAEKENAKRTGRNTETIPRGRARSQAPDRDLRVSESKNAESNDSDGTKPVLAELRKYPDGDYDGWKMALAVLKYLGPMTDGPARAFLAKTKNAHSLSPKMLAEIALATWTAKAEEPRSYMVDQAKRQRSEADSDPADDYWPLDFQDREVERFKRGVGLWPSDLGAQPGSNLCRIDPTILEKYGFPVPTWRAAEKS